MSAYALFAMALMLGQLAPTLPTDPRIQLVAYNPGQVVTLPVAIGYAAVVDLGPDERVESVVVGNSADWQVTASKRGDQVVVKPLAGAASTNMVVTTGDRRYVFLLQTGGETGSPFVMRFTYPEADMVQLPTATLPVATFRYRGAKSLFPVTMTDDGHRTSVTWGRDTAVPGIFAVEKDGREAIVNARMMGGDYVIERTAERFVLRLGKEQATARRRLLKRGR